MGRGDEEVLDDVLLLGLHARHALAAAPLAPVRLDVRPLDVARARDRDDHLLVGEQVLDRELGRLGDDLGPARVAVLLLDREQVLADDRHQLRVGREDALELLDEREGLLVLLDDLVALELSEALQPHVQDRARLDLRELEPRHQGVLGRVGALSLPDQPDHDVEVLDGLAEARQDVGLLLGARQVEARPPRDDLAAEADERLEHLLQVDDLRPPVHQCQHDDPERRLHLRMLVELVHHDLRDLAAGELEHHADALTARLVADLGEPLDLLLPGELRDLLDQARLVHLVRQLGDDDRLAAAAHRLGVRLRAERDRAAAGRVGLRDPGGAVDGAPRREIRALDRLHQVGDRRRRLVDEHDERVHDLGEIVRRDVRGHSDRDARRAVDDEVRDARGEHRGLLERLVEVRREVDGVLVDVGEHLVRDLRQTRLGVTHRRRRVAVDRAEVPLPVHERVAQGELLDHADQGFVDR